MATLKLNRNTKTPAKGMAERTQIPKAAALPKGFGQSTVHPKGHPGPGWNTHSRTHAAKSGKSGRFT